MVEKSPVGVRRGMVELIDDYDVEEVRREADRDRAGSSDWIEAKT